jgi:hypothetical protein
MFTCRLEVLANLSAPALKHRGRLLSFIVLLLLVVCAGCSAPTNDKFVPTETKARESLEAALTAWKNGKKPEEIDAAPIKVQVADAQWQSGKKLIDFEIVSQEHDEGTPTFSVRLTIQGKAQPFLTRYYVVGKDPLWVYSEESYKGKSGM